MAKAEIFIRFSIILISITNILISQNNSSSQQDLLDLYGGINPCDDEIFALMKDKGINGLSDREYDYYKIQSNKCDEYRKTILESKDKNIDEITTPTDNNNTIATTIDKKSLYLAGRKDPGSAGFLHFILPSSGHAYAGNWSKGMPFLLASSIGYLILSSSVTESEEWGIVEEGYYSWDDVYGYKTVTKVNKGSYNLGLGMMLTSFVWGIVDASKLVKKQNNELYKSIYGTDMPIGFDELVRNKKPASQKPKTQKKTTGVKTPVTKTKK